ncbi:MAG: diaminopimelate decarboxylase [Candidatus Kapabacteria bacterium]|nr:diaminopimelate decarboxylase [Candidatus Kapabacteria bacterium]
MEKLKYERPIINKINLGIPNKFGTKPKFEPITQIDGVPVQILAEKFGSPVMVISEKKIKETYKEAKRAFTTRYPKVQFAWSYKTNYLDAVCRIFHKMGSWAEVVSGFEYDKALSNGMPGNQIIFNGPDKSLKDLEKAVINKSYIHIDHFDELYDLIEIAEKLDEKPKVAIRINMNTGIYPIWDKFGFNLENGDAWNAINKIMISGKLDLVGLHTHIGTFINTVEPYGVATTKLMDLVIRINEKFHTLIKYIDLGGGFASTNTLRGSYLQGSDTCPSFDAYAEAITNSIINSGMDIENLPMLILESGRALIDEAGSIVGSVIANKRLADGRRSMIIDVGVNILFTAFWYDHLINPGQSFSYNSEETTIYGPLCMNIDCIRPNMQFPVLKKGDLIVISKIGAYNMTQWMQFITMRPNVVLIDLQGQTHVIRQNETLETITSLELIPDYLKS